MIPSLYRLGPLLLIATLACGDKEGASAEEGDADADGDSDADTDADSDADADADSDADADGDSDADTDADTDTDIPADAMDGSVITMDGFADGDVLAARAFSHRVGDTTLVYVAANPAATCADVAAYLSASDVEPDPSSLFADNTCNLVFSTINSLPATYDLQTSSVGMIVHADCAFGEGDFDFTSIDGDEGYFWSGTWYVGEAWKGEFTIDENEDGVYIDGTLGGFDGRYPYAGYPDSMARASVSGVVHGVECPALGDTVYF
jgi:hypothetical protein